MTLAKAQIGRCGELLVQLELLKRGIESSALTTDTGIDLVAYFNEKSKALTIQVKCNLKAKPGGGKGRPHLDWWIPLECPADIVALSELEENRIWLFTASEIRACAQQQTEGRIHMMMAIEIDTPKRRDGKPSNINEFDQYLINNAIPRIVKNLPDKQVKILV